MATFVRRPNERVFNLFVVCVFVCLFCVRLFCFVFETGSCVCGIRLR